MLNGSIEPGPIFSVFDRFQYHNNPRFLLKIGVRHQASERRAEDCVLRSEVFKNDGEGEKIILEDVRV